MIVARKPVDDREHLLTSIYVAIVNKSLELGKEEVVLLEDIDEIFRQVGLDIKKAE
jgi:hypothetical protein